MSNKSNFDGVFSSSYQTQSFLQSKSIEEDDSFTKEEATQYLASLRQDIDKIDNDIAKLLQKRQSLVKKAAKVKQQAHECVVSPHREQEILNHGKVLEEQYQLPHGLMQDIQKRILRQSYVEKGSGRYKCTFIAKGKDSSINSQCKVVIVGGQGAMGKFFYKYLSNANYQVFSVEKDDYFLNLNDEPTSIIKESKAAYYLQQAQWCIVSVPIDVCEQVIKNIAPFLNPDCVLSDLTSVKTKPVQTMLQAHQGPVLGLHPMFGPDTFSLVKQVIVAVDGRKKEQYGFILEQLRAFGAKVVECSAKEHDEVMRVIQALRHFSTFAYGVFLRSLALKQQKNIKQKQIALMNQDQAKGSDFVKNLLHLSSPVYHLELLMVGRLFAQDPHLYCEIISASPENLKLVEQYIQCTQECFQDLLSGDKSKFIQEFEQTTEFFGDYAKIFLKESSDILAKAQDNYLL